MLDLAAHVCLASEPAGAHQPGTHHGCENLAPTVCLPKVCRVHILLTILTGEAEQGLACMPAALDFNCGLESLVLEDLFVWPVPLTHPSVSECP